MGEAQLGLYGGAQSPACSRAGKQGLSPLGLLPSPEAAPAPRGAALGRVLGALGEDAQLWCTGLLPGAAPCLPQPRGVVALPLCLAMGLGDPTQQL